MLDYRKMNLQELLSCQGEIKRLAADLENRIRIHGNATATEKAMLEDYLSRYELLNRLILKKTPI